MKKILVDNYINLQNGFFLCECLDLTNNESFDITVSDTEVYDYLGEWVTIDKGEGDSYEMRNTAYFCAIGISETESLFAEIINKRLNRTELPDMPDVFGALGAILKPDYTDMVQDIAHSHIINPDIID